MKEAAKKLLNLADIEIGGNRPWDIEVKNEEFYSRVLSGGSLALGESYMDGWWECEAIDQMIDKVLRAGLYEKVKNSKSLLWNIFKAKLINMQSQSRAKIVGKRHYDIGNELYKKMLDKRMNYSCGFWKNANNLDEAQEAKLDLICKKLHLEPGMTLLDIGCGWGALTKYATEKYGVKATGITISREQAKLAKERCAGLDAKIKIEDYRNLKGNFDRIASVGMFEHVGYKNYREFMRVANRNLKKDGVFLLHTIGGNETAKTTEPWLNKYIFPNGMIPSPVAITKAVEGIFRLEDWHNFGNDYDKTLMEWHKNFNNSWDEIKENYDERFKRMWNYYLLICAGSFRARYNQLWQVVLTKTSSSQKYKNIR